MIARIKTLAAATLVAVTLAGPALAAGEVAIEAQDWSFGGIFGTFDRGELQRGLQVYQNVCATCHGLKHVAYRNLGDLGYTDDEVKVIAAEKQTTDGPNDEGEMFERAALPSDRFVSPFPNDAAARAANGGAYPPDLSLIVDARAGGADYIYGLLTGYKEPPAGVTVPDGMYYNTGFGGHQIAMPPPLFPDGVTYGDGTSATIAQQARDVSAFLAWASEPNLEQRKRAGVMTILFLLVFTGLLYATKRKIWAAVH